MTNYKKIIFCLVLLGLASCKGRKDHLKNQFLLRGNVELEKKEYKAAINLYTEAINLDPNYAEAYNNRGIAHYEDGDAISAVEDYKKALEINPRYIDAYYNRANAYAAINKIENSIKDLDRVEKAYPDSAYVIFTRGIVYFEGGSFNKRLKHSPGPSN